MSPARILIVEDEQITATDIEDILGAIGHEVVAIVASGRAAIEHAERDRPDLVLMDIRLKGDIDGIDAARAIRERRGIPSVFLTAHADDSTLDRAKLAEPLGYIVKPFQEAELNAAIQMALHKSRLDKLREADAHDLAATLDALGDAVVRCDARGEVIYLNAAAERWTGWSLAAARGLSIAEVLRLRNRATGETLDRFVLGAPRERTPVDLPANAIVRSRDGVEREACGQCAPVREPNGETAGAVFLFGRPCVNPGEGAPAAESRAGRPAAAPRGGEPEIVVASPAMREVMKFAGRVASSGAGSILLLGESGSGKDVVAEYLHRQSPRAAGPFVTLNCAAIPDTLLESELFGYEKGAFTDARAQKKGAFDLADGGTIFLDEIGELQPHLQAKLLRVLESQTFRRLGGLRDIQVETRIVAATNRNLAEAVREQRFREDLYYRLNVIAISIPPLRERREDVLPLVEFFVRRYNERFRRHVRGIAPEACPALVAYDWPGNVRELRNVVERAMVLEDGDWLSAESLQVGEAALAATASVGTANGAPATLPSMGGASLEEVERAMLVQALEKCGGNQTRAAEALSISRDTLRYRVKKYGLR